MTARYPIAIEPGTERTAFGIVVQDRPGCFSTGDTLDVGDAIPGPSSLHVIRMDAAYAVGFAVVSMVPGLLDDTIERVNIALPRRVLKRLASEAETRQEGCFGDGASCRDAIWTLELAQAQSRKVEGNDALAGFGNDHVIAREGIRHVHCR